ncbi:MAG: hemolysin III family protein [Deltaproteobacteria bacterium]|nr:hemolysin III family protein [Deltaproteobacteria bacterium]
MITKTSTSRYSFGEEIANSISHGTGIVLAIAGLAVLTTFASIFGTVWHVVGCSIYGSTLVLLYTASTLYHSIQQPRAKAVLRILDHSGIFLLIAGTYTPFMLVNLRGPWGWSLFGMIWGLAVVGIILQTTLLRHSSIASVVLYVTMGWAVVVAIKPLLATVAAGGLMLLVVGGLAYTFGIAFFAWRRLPFHHSIWHLFVLVGSITHFFAILFYVVPVAE